MWAGFGGGQGEQLGGQCMDLALGGCGVDQRVGPRQCHDACDCHVRVVDRAVERGPGFVVFLGDLGASAHLGDQFLLRVEVVGQFGLQQPDLVE